MFVAVGAGTGVFVAVGAGTGVFVAVGTGTGVFVAVGAGVGTLVGVSTGTGVFVAGGTVVGVAVGGVWSPQATDRMMTAIPAAIQALDIFEHPLGSKMTISNIPQGKDACQI